MVKLKEVIKKFIQFFKRYWIFIVLAMVASSLLIFRIIQGERPSLKPQPTPPSLITLSQPKISGTTIPTSFKTNLSDFSFPSRLKIYQGQEVELTSDKAQKIAQEFSFSGSPQEAEDVFLGTFFIWSSEKASFSVGLDAHEIEYDLNLYETQSLTQNILPSPEAAKTTLEDLLSKLDLKPGFELKWQKGKYLTGGYKFPPTSASEEADFIKMGANPAIGQYQLVGLNPTEPLISLVLNKKKEIVRFQYQVYFSGIEGLETYDLKTEEEVETMLLSEGRIVYFGTFQKSVGPPEITQAEFNQITLAYYQDPDKNPIIQPIYILSGQGTLENGEKTEIIAYLPAIKFGTQIQENLEVPREFFELPELP